MPGRMLSRWLYWGCQTEKWERDICVVNATADGYTQESYAAVSHTIQLDWILFQNVTKNMVHSFKGLETVLQETFLPRLFFIISKNLPTDVGALSTSPVKKSVLVLEDPMP